MKHKISESFATMWSQRVPADGTPGSGMPW